jgi:GT2 family glycosyltransferase
VLPARDEAEAIAACLDGLVSQTYPAELLEILVIDGRSSDATRDIVLAKAAHDARIRLLDNPDRITAAALNVGIRAARHDTIVRMDGHSVPRTDHVARCVEILAEIDAWAVGGVIERTGQTPTERAIAAATSSPLGVGDAAHNYATTGRFVEAVFPGAWRRDVFERVGLFDPELARNEDDELSFRIRAAGGRIWFDPRIVCRYRPRPTLRRLFDQYRLYACYKVRVFQKHPRAARWRHLVPPLWVAGLVCGAALSLVSPLGMVVLAISGLGYLAVIGGGAMLFAPPGVGRARLLASFVVLHVAYGIGFWQGMLRFAPKWFRGRRGTVPGLRARDAA